MVRRASDTRWRYLPQVAEVAGFLELHHAAPAGNATCVSFATTDLVKDISCSLYTGARRGAEASLREMNDTVNIDYTGLQPGDDAPEDGDPKAAPRPGTANVIVLSAEPTLIDLMRDSLAGTHRVWRADDATHAADLMVAAGNAVFVLDSSLADTKIKDLINQVHKQFPELPIILAGQREDEAELGPLVSEGTIFRFLHKPASAERIRNFVDATQRRTRYRSEHDATALRPAAATGTTGTHPKIEAPRLAMPKIRVDHAAVRRWTRRSLLVITLGLLAWGLATWRPWEKLSGFDLFASRHTTPVAAIDAGKDPAVLKLLDDAGIALSQGKLVEPEDHNALTLYREVLERDPGNEMARRGVALVADELLVRAEDALMRQDVPALASAVDAARSARPDHPRLSFFIAQLDRERERILHPSTPSSAVNANVGRALDQASQQSTAGRVQGLVQLANDRMRSNRLTDGKDSAQAYLLAARRLDPADAALRENIATLSKKLQSAAERDIRDGRLDEASGLLHSAVALDVDQEAIASLRADLEAARAGNLRQDRAKLLVLANQRIAQGRLLEPAADSARHYMDLVRAADPAFDGLPETTAVFANTALIEARTAAATGDFGRADALLKAAADAGADGGELTAAASQITTARAAKAAPPPSVVAENTMQRVRFEPPTYPQRAREKGTQGWVDLEFTVASDGSTHEAVIKASDPAGVFDRAALDAVARWRYQPKMVNGTVVDQRVKARLRFELAD